NSCRRIGVPRISSTYAVSASRAGGAPYTRPVAISTPTTTASPIDRHDRTIVMADARKSDGRYRLVASHFEVAAALDDVSKPITDGTGSPASTRAYSFG